ncbi:MAG: hypothetical protein EBR82_88835 [Caulobacteraceae bacterium]|nr:hypothetical protein [Caulobacteraceae bacterium]
MYKVDSFNREMIIERYVTDIVGDLHFLETKEMLKNCLIDKKRSLSNDDLEIEIMRHDPLLLSDIYLEEILEEV